jgi:4-hydroxy-3-methylbut-2-enyl diphosphate reductase IspH
MKIILAEHFGMCFGVRDAIAQAEDRGWPKARSIKEDRHQHM